MIRWNKKYVIIFILSLGCFYLLIQSVVKILNREQDKIDAHQISIIQENVKDRFKLYLKLPLSIGMIGAEYFASGDILTKPYGKSFDEVLEINTEILGLNVLDRDGKIVRTYPLRNNLGALGKKSQNHSQIVTSYKNGEGFWFSPPFKLFQGEPGFSFYNPIMEKGEHKGWFATVIRTREFVQEFSLAELLKVYELIIKDTATEIPYFSTSMGPTNGIKVYESREKIFGREIVFLSWRKQSSVQFSLPWQWMALLSVIFSIGLVQFLKLMDHRRTSRQQLTDIGILLKLTSNEALANLVDVQSGVSKNKEDDASGYLNNLLEQINLLQAMAQDSNDLYQEQFSLEASLNEQLRNFAEIVSKKNLSLAINRERMFGAEIVANRWLFQHSILSNVISHALVHAQSGGEIKIGYHKWKSIHRLTVEIDKIQENKVGVNWDRRMEVAKKTLHLYQGNLTVENTDSRGILMVIEFPEAES